MTSGAGPASRFARLMAGAMVVAATLASCGGADGTARPGAADSDRGAPVRFARIAVRDPAADTPNTLNDGFWQRLARR